MLEVSSFRSRLEQLLHEMKSEHHHGKSGQTAITLIPEISPDGTVLAISPDKNPFVLLSLNDLTQVPLHIQSSCKMNKWNRSIGINQCQP